MILMPIVDECGSACHTGHTGVPRSLPASAPAAHAPSQDAGTLDDMKKAMRKMELELTKLRAEQRELAAAAAARGGAISSAAASAASPAAPALLYTYAPATAAPHHRQAATGSLQPQHPYQHGLQPQQYHLQQQAPPQRVAHAPLRVPERAPAPPAASQPPARVPLANRLGGVLSLKPQGLKEKV